jgi:probable rRNA maturation factor
VIAFPYASAQAAREGHHLGDSLSLLVVHGTLHLIGYDHDTPAARAAMWAAQEAALRALDVPLEIVPALEGEHGDDKAKD